MLYFREGEAQNNLAYFKMSRYSIVREKQAQVAIEYLLLLTAVVAIVLIGFRTYLTDIQETSNTYYNRVVPGILGKPPDCGDGICIGAPFETPQRCPADCS